MSVYIKLEQLSLLHSHYHLLLLNTASRKNHGRLKPKEKEIISLVYNQIEI
jgi:hypothetical protein